MKFLLSIARHAGRLARRANKGKGNLGASVICASRKRGQRVAPVSWTSALGSFRQWRVA
ncbi:hypothetical protein A2U01_0085321, partial [Trifolium medium]|nr:hypothetical protein [Trifolium medium]